MDASHICQVFNVTIELSFWFYYDTDINSRRIASPCWKNCHILPQTVGNPPRNHVHLSAMPLFWIPDGSRSRIDIHHKNLSLSNLATKKIVPIAPVCPSIMYNFLSCIYAYRLIITILSSILGQWFWNTLYIITYVIKDIYFINSLFSFS